MEIPKEVQEEIVKFQALQNQLNAIVAQKNEIKALIAAIDEALKQLQATEGTVYLSVGNILIPKDREELKKELEDRKESLVIRMKSLEKREKQLTNTLLQLKKKIEAALGGSGAQAA